MSGRRDGRLGSFHELGQFEIDEASVKLLGYRYCQENSLVILGQVDPSSTAPITIGMVDPGNEPILAELQRVLGRAVQPVRLNADEIQLALDRGYGRDGANDPYRLTLRPVDDISFGRDTTAVDLLNQVFGRAVHLHASDIHLETYEDDVDVRFRIDGILHQIATPFSRANIQGVISRLKILGGLDIAERRVAQDGRIRAVFVEGGAERRIDFRLSVVPGPFGEDAVLRVLDASSPLIGLEELGLQPAALAALDRLIGNPEGLILVTGPTGSGKTTTLYAALDRLSSPAKKILTVEDPIEYHLAKTCQKGVSEQMGFADYARAFMRQNPDVILIGEIRDEETADVALRAAQTGHLVLSTLHTNDAVRTVTRLGTLGVDRNLLAGSFLGALAQRLVRRLCAACRREEELAPAGAARLGLPPGEQRCFRGAGCAACNGTGFRGRTGIYELFLLDDELADRVAAGEPVHRLRELAVRRGMQTLLDDALHKAQAGLTSPEEVLRVMPYRLISSQLAARSAPAEGG